MKPATDPVNRVVTLTALCLAYNMTATPLLERAIAIMQRDTQVWLRQHPEHVHTFCDAYCDQREEAHKLAEELTGKAIESSDWLSHRGTWNVLARRYETHRAHEERIADAGYSTLDLRSLMKKTLSDEQIRKIDERIDEANRHRAEDIAAGRDQDWLMHYSFWVPTREENYGEFMVGIPKRYIKQMKRIQDYRFAGGRFPTREFTEYFADLRSAEAISASDHENLKQWMDYESQPKAKRDAMDAASPYRPVTDLPNVVKLREMLSDYDGEGDELDDSDLLSISMSRGDATRLLESLEHPADRDEHFQNMMNKIRQSFDDDDVDEHRS